MPRDKNQDWEKIAKSTMKTCEKVLALPESPQGCMDGLQRAVSLAAGISSNNPSIQ